MSHPRFLAIGCSFALALLVATPHAIAAGLAAAPSIVGVNRAVSVWVIGVDEGPAEVRLIDPRTGRLLGLAAAPASASSGRVSLDLAEVFPILWTMRQPRTLVAQLHVDGAPEGAPLVLQPMIEPATTRDGLTAAVMNAYLRGDAAELTRLLQIDEAERQRLRARVVVEPTTPVVSGLRMRELSRLVLQTDAGRIVIELYPWAAPGAVAHVVELVEAGLYDGVTFHRVIAADERGAPFLVQTGDPTGSGAGGCGAWRPFEPSDVPHTVGVVSLARKPDDPNSNGSQFFVCLSKAAGAALDGRFVAFGRVIEGMDAVWTIAAGETDDQDRPNEPLVIERAWTEPAPPITAGAIDARAQGAPRD